MDFKLTLNGDIELTNGDIADIKDKSLLVQHAISRLKSVKIDWFKDNIGADMEELIGLPNTRETGDLGKDKIIKAMTEDELFKEGEVEVSIYPVSKTSIAYNVAFDKAPYGKFELNATLDLVKGINVWEV